MDGRKSRGTQALADDEHVDLTQPATIIALCERLATRSVRRLDVLLLVAGVCDARAVPGPASSSLPRVAWVNFLGHVLLLAELERRRIVVGRVVLIGSGTYNACIFSSLPPPPTHPSLSHLSN